MEKAIGKSQKDSQPCFTAGGWIWVVVNLMIGPSAPWLAELLGASGAVKTNAVSYMQIRLFGAPAVLLTLVSFGALRGRQDMKTPLVDRPGSKCTEFAARLVDDLR